MRLTVAIPTYNNTHQLIDTLVSMVRNTAFCGRILVINNGEPGTYATVQGAVPYEVDWIDAGKNLGWQGGINLALSHADTELFCMMNDDVLFPPANTDWWKKLLRWFDLEDVAGAGPTSNYVAGAQSAFQHYGHPVLMVPFLIGFCAVYRTDLLKELGGLDESLPGGDDLDLALRIKAKGLELVADRRCYLHHIGSQTGQRLFPGHWDSQLHQADTYNALIRKHGLAEWFELLQRKYSDRPSYCIDRHAVRVTHMAMQSRDQTITGLFSKARTEPSDTSELLDVLRRFAVGCKVIVETGVDDGTTTAAFLKARPKELHSYDLHRHEAIDNIEAIAKAEGQHFEFHQADILSVDIPECDFWYCDDLHTYAHVKQELEKHAPKARKYMAFHDTEFFADWDENQAGPGIWLAISEYLMDHPEWRLVYTTESHNGLAIFARVA